MDNENKQKQEDKELDAIRTIMKALSPLGQIQQKSALDYVAKRFSINTNLENTFENQGSFDKGKEVNNVNSSNDEVIKDIRALKEDKSPKSAIQMAVLVAYYLSKIVKSEDKMDSIGITEIERYFDQANYPRIKNPSVLLSDTKKAGYFESAERGRYKLNPVGYNLAAYNMGSGSSKISKSDKKRFTK